MQQHSKVSTPIYFYLYFKVQKKSKIRREDHKSYEIQMQKH